MPSYQFAQWVCHNINIMATELASELKQLTAIIVKGEEPACTNALKSIQSISIRDGVEREMFQHPGLFDVLLKVAKEDNGDTRVSSLKAIGNIATCVENLREMFQHPGLIPLVSRTLGRCFNTQD